MNPYSAVSHTQEHAIFEAGYAEALLDFFDYLSGNPSLFESVNFDKVDKVVEQARNKVPSKV